MVVSYRNSTSNHNNGCSHPIQTQLYLIEILHQTTTEVAVIVIGWSCILSKFYIKPQPPPLFRWHVPVVSYRNSTSNHNIAADRGASIKLYLIEILHQTTTTFVVIRSPFRLYLIEILHQTTTATLSPPHFCCCILSKFYIKPQREPPRTKWGCVVSYRNSTSNHNAYQVTLSNGTSCILSKFYIKPQPYLLLHHDGTRCILSKFYIKPQLSPWPPEAGCSCILSKFYIKPQRRFAL